MSMMEVAVGAGVGAVSGSALTLLASYAQMRFNRKEGQRQRVVGETEEVWRALHTRQRAVNARRSPEGSVPRTELDEAAGDLGAQLMQISMIMFPGDFHTRLYNSGQILSSVPFCEDLPDIERLRVTREVITHAQWVCAAYMAGNPLPEPLSAFDAYYRGIVPRRFWMA
ncbi:hypothetical protein [Streptomyces sp. NPDC058739]|uniref:hypothetical protein n=1 Tax=Streptomyces sp. NPDC058739 TaxID=3346618 RepID=UPI0036B8B1CD